MTGTVEGVMCPEFITSRIGIPVLDNRLPILQNETTLAHLNA